MRVSLLFIVSLLVIQLSRSQDTLSWYQQNPYPQGMDYDGCVIINQDYFYAYAWGTIVRTKDAGSTWDVTKLTPYKNIRGLGFFNDNIGIVSIYNIIYRTTDGGDSWEPVYKESSNELFVGEIVITSDTSAYVNCRIKKLLYTPDCELLYTTDCGESWIIKGTPYMLDGVVPHFSFCNDLEGWIFKFGSIWPNEYTQEMYSTKNGGTDWEKITLPYNPYGVDVKGLYKTSSNEGWIFCDDKLYKTEDNGNSWIQKFQINDFINFDFSDTNNLFINEGSVIWHSGDNGTTWDSIESGINMFQRTYFYNDEFWIRIHANYIYSTSNSGQDWKSLTSGSRCNFNGVYFFDEYVGWAWGTDNDSIKIFKTHHSGYPWDLVYSATVSPDARPDQNSFHPCFLDSTFAWACGSTGLLRSSDGGESWTNISYPEGSLVTSIYPVSFDTVWIAGTAGKVFLTYDGGSQWIDRSIDDGDFEAISICCLNDSNIWISGHDNIYYSWNEGKSWENQLHDWPTYFSDLHMFSQYFGSVSSYFDIYLTWNGGDSWNRVGFWDDHGIDHLQYLDYNHFYAFSRSNDELFKSSNSGYDWVAISTFGNSELNSFYFLDSLTGWAVGDNGTIYYTKPFSPGPPGYVQQEPGTKQELLLYPNPCSDILHLKYQLSEKMYMLCDLYTITGQKIKSLVNSRQIPGTYELEITIKDLPQGIYLIKWQVGNNVEVQKLIKADI